jgi:hypothetical protein
VGLSLICASRRILNYTTRERNVDHVDLVKKTPESRSPPLLGKNKKTPGSGFPSLLNG